MNGTLNSSSGHSYNRKIVLNSSPPWRVRWDWLITTPSSYNTMDLRTISFLTTLHKRCKDYYNHKPQWISFKKRRPNLHQKLKLNPFQDLLLNLEWVIDPPDVRNTWMISWRIHLGSIVVPQRWLWDNLMSRE